MPAIKQITRFRNLPTILALVTASVATTWLLLSAKAEYERDIHLGERQTQLLATGLQDTTERQFNEINGEIVAIHLALERQLASVRPSGEVLRDEVLRLLDDDDDILRVIVIANGSEILDTSPMIPEPPAVDIATIVWSPLETAFPFGFVNIGMPMALGDGSLFTVPLRYKFTDRADSVEIIALTDATQILHSYESVELAPGSAFAVFRSDGILLARWPEMAKYLGRKFDGPIFGHQIQVARSSTIRARIETDSNERILTYRTARGWPLVVVAGVPVRGLLASWLASLPGKSVLLLFILSAIFLLWAALRRSQTALLRSVEELTVSEGRYARLLANIPGGVFTRRFVPPDRFNYPFVSPGFRELFGFGGEELAENAMRLRQLIHPDDREALINSMIASCEGDEVWSREFRMVKPTGQMIWVQSLARRYRGENGEILWDGISIDVTDLRQYQALLEQVQKIAGLGYWTWQPELGTDPHDLSAHRCEYSPACGVILGLSPADMNFTDAEFMERILHPGDLERILREYHRFLDAETATHDIEYRILRPDRSVRWVRESATKEIVEGTVVRVVGVMMDITEAKVREAALAQSQKMEAIGGLTGGVAHDFNNLLTVIMGNLEALLIRIKNDATMTDLAQAALGAADRGATLTRRLLAFARRQPLSPQPTDLRQILVDLMPLLNRSVGALIQVEIKAAPGLPKAMVDPHQLENAIINLANNARDAMPRGGKLTIQVDQSMPPADGDGEAAPEGGRALFLCLSITDTGTGMAREVTERAIEPFFTTKPVGQGTGLGLSMVYGLAKQSKGHLRIYSEPGVGTTIKIYLPQAEPGAAIAAPIADKVADFAGTNVLLVDDDRPVRTTTAAILRSLGFEVTEASSGKEALRILESAKPLDVLVTDVVLAGGILGPEVAERARALRPQMKILFISGFTSDALAEHRPLLSKPFRRAELAKQLGDLLQN